MAIKILSVTCDPEYANNYWQNSLNIFTLFVNRIAIVRNYECNHELRRNTSNRGLLVLGTGQLTVCVRSFTYIS